MADLPVIGAQLSVLDLGRNRDWLFEKNRDIELPEFCLADVLRSPQGVIDMAKTCLEGWNGRLGIHGPYSGFGLDTKDPDVRSTVQARLDQALDVCAELGAVWMVVHSPFDQWDAHNLEEMPNGLEQRLAAILDTLSPALKRAEETGTVLVLENIKDVDPAHRAAVIEAAASPSLKLSVDVGHANWAHAMAGAPSPDRFVSSAGGMLGHIHLQDTDGYADRHWVPGEGNIPFHAVFAALSRVKADPHLIVEIREFGRVQEAVAHLETLGLGQ